MMSGAIEARYDLRDVTPPNEGTVMIKMRETARHALFYIGEILVTETTIQIGGKVGIGIVAGSDGELSRYMAVIDAAYNNGLPETAGWESLLVEEESRIAEALARESALVLKTRVSFETMKAE
jgi:alpha-D-ribose 1-methylphosphonate 5-triphosphate synthase subunit PhnG